MTILIDVAAEFTGAKAFKQADKATNTLTKSALNLGKTLGITFGAAAVLGYAKASVQAAAKDQKAQKQLALALKNVGLERDAASAESYIQRLQSEFGVVDDLLRPAYQTLAIATRDTAETQKLLNLALDISAATSKDLGSVTSALSKAYLGSNTALSKLGVGISKADLKTKSFEEVTAQLAKTFKGAAAESAATFAGSIAKLGVASENVKEIIGKGIIDALMILGEDTSVSGLATDMESAATNAAALLVTLSKVIKTLSTPIVATSGALAWFIEHTSPFVDLIVTGDPTGLMGLKKPAPSKNPIQSGTYLKNQKAVTKSTQDQQKAQSKILADKKSTAILDKANAALGKGTDLFNMDAIQLNAALINQAEQLGKVTNAAQLLAITNDITRLKIKQDIIALEDAIASKDDAAITAATNKLNKDLLILSALQNQNLKLADIKSILDSIVPKDLINQANLDAALLKIQQMMALLAKMGTATTSTTGATGATGATSTTGTLGMANPIPIIGAAGVDYNPTQNPDRNYSNGFANGVLSGAGITYNPNQQGDRNYDIKIYANTIANPDELSGLIQDTIIRLNKQGDYITTAGAL
jgi:hypothetical protein